MPELMPAICFGHGNPMNAVLTNGYTEAWRRIGGEMRKPKAILSISAHWYVPGTGVTISTSPLPAASSNCSHPCRSRSTIHGASITGLGRCSYTPIRRPIYQSCN